MIKADEVLENLKKLIGSEFDADDVICAFEDFEEGGETEVIVKESENGGYDNIAYINASGSTQFLFTLSDGTIIDVWMV